MNVKVQFKLLFDGVEVADDASVLEIPDERREDEIWQVNTASFLGSRVTKAIIEAFTASTLTTEDESEGGDELES